MSPSVKTIVVVSIAIVALAAIVAVPAFALLDAQTPIDALFGFLAPESAPSVEDVTLPASPAIDVRSPRAPPATA